MPPQGGMLKLVHRQFFTLINIIYLYVLLTDHIALPQAYVELNEIQGNNWQETARWVGYEENLNLATGKWGPSHVSYLTFKSLLQVRKTMSTGDFWTLNEK